jgi:hypothetical protein
MLLDVIIMLFIDLWRFSTDPPYFGYNSIEQENPVLCILRFRNLLELKLTWDFLGINILSQEAAGDQEVNERGHEAQTRPSGVGPRPGCATQVRLDLGPPMSIFAPDRLA